jgi:hypothetical protein
MRKKTYLLLFNLFISTYYFTQTWVPATPFPMASGTLPSSMWKISSLCEYNSELIVAGNFTGIGGIVAHGIAKWNGSNWNAIGPGNFLQEQALDVVVYNGELYFTSDKLYKWDGVTIQEFSFFNPAENAISSVKGADLHVFNNKLYIVNYSAAYSQIIIFDGGNFNTIPLNNQMGAAWCLENYNNYLHLGTSKGLYKLDNSNNWVNCTGVTSQDPFIFDLEEYNGELYALGQISSIGGITVQNLAKYNGNSWIGVNLPNGYNTNTLIFDVNILGTNHLSVNNNELYLAGQFSSLSMIDPPTPLIKYNGNQWIQLSNNYTYQCGGCSIIYNNSLYCGGNFSYFSDDINLVGYGNFVRLSTPLGIENESLQTFSISPNPASDNLTVSIPEQFIGSSYTLCDQFGKTLFKGNLLEKTNTIDLTNLASGIYFLSVEGMAEVERVVKN